MSERYDGQVALITGSTRGMGKAAALALADAGATVVINSRSAENCQAVAKEIRARGQQALALPADLSDLVQAGNLVASTIGRLGRLDILVNNAGHFGGAGPFWTHSLEHVLHTLHLNFTQVFVASQAAARQMIQQRRGCIINVSTGGTIQAHEGMAVYDAAKAAVESLTRCMAVELAPHGVRVNCIRPGALRTWPEEFVDNARNRSRLALIPYGRFGTPEDFAALVLFLCSKDSEYIVGQVITLDGGRSCHIPLAEIESREQALEEHGIQVRRHTCLSQRAP